MKQRCNCTALERLTALLLAVLLTAGLLAEPAAAAGTAHFADVPAGHWAYQYVEQAYEDGAIAGTGGDPARGSGVFDPDRQMTFGELLTMLASAFYPQELAQEQKAGGAWYAPAIRVALNHGLSFLDADELMNTRAEKPISRFHASYAVVKLLQDRGVPLPSQKEREAAAAQIADWSAMSESTWSYYAASVYALGVMTGVDGQGTFDGSGTITRASAAVIYTKIAGKVQPGEPYQLVYGSGWELITVPGYRENLERAFYETYPRVVARWGDETTQRTVPINVQQELIYGDNQRAFMWAAWGDYNPNTKLWDRYIEIAAEDQDTRASWALTHELVHVAQSYDSLDSSWWTESMASYGNLRYCSWSDPYFFEMEDYFQLEDGSQQNWNFEAYGGHWFFAWMDYRYPTTPQSLGLIDSIHTAIKAGQITSDNINDPKFNAVVQQVTGVSTIDQLRRQFVQELTSGAWVFRGFADYPDNYITENLPGVPNPVYLTPEEANLCSGAYTYSVSGETASGPAANLVDGNRSTKWQASPKDVTASNLSYDVQHSLCITLEKEVTFDSYVLYHESSEQATVSWRLQYYDSNAQRWVKLDSVSGNRQGVTSRSFEPVTTQFLWLEVLNPSGSGDGTVRLYELELYDNR